MTTAATVTALHAAVGIVRPGVNGGDRVTINHPALPEPATGTVSSAAWGSETIIVRLDGTDAFVPVPESYLERIHP